MCAKGYRCVQKGLFSTELEPSAMFSCVSRVWLVWVSRLQASGAALDTLSSAVCQEKDVWVADDGGGAPLIEIGGFASGWNGDVGVPASLVFSIYPPR